MNQQVFPILRKKCGTTYDPFLTINTLKMHSIRFIGKSREDLAEIYTYISADNPFYAEEVLSRIHKSIEYLKTFPFIGTKIS